MDNRGVSAVVEKLLVAGIVLLFVSGMTTVLVGGIVPEYRASAGEELGERVVARVANAVDASLPAVDGRVTVETHLSVPSTLAGTAYRLALRNGSVTLVHPNPAIGATGALALPAGYRPAESTVESGPPLRVRVSGPAGNRTVALQEREG